MSLFACLGLPPPCSSSAGESEVLRSAFPRLRRSPLVLPAGLLQPLSVLRAARAGALPRPASPSLAGGPEREVGADGPHPRTSRVGSGGRSASAAWTRCPSSALGLAADVAPARPGGTSSAATGSYPYGPRPRSSPRARPCCTSSSTGDPLRRGASAGPAARCRRSRPGPRALARRLPRSPSWPRRVALLAREAPPSSLSRRPPAPRGGEGGRARSPRPTVLGVFLLPPGPGSACRATSGGSRRTRPLQLLLLLGSGSGAGPVPRAPGEGGRGTAVAPGVLRGTGPLLTSSTRWCFPFNRGR